MKKIYELLYSVEYQKDGETKKRYVNIGSVFEGDKGMSIKIEQIPVGWNGWAGCYVPKEREKKSESVSSPAIQDASQPKPFSDFSDDIPF